MALDVESIVRERYGAAATGKEEALCCPVEYNPEYLKIIPDEISDGFRFGGVRGVCRAYQR